MKSSNSQDATSATQAKTSLAAMAAVAILASMAARIVAFRSNLTPEAIARKYSVNPSPALAFSRSGGYSRPSWTTDQPPCSVSRPCGSQSRNWHPSPLVLPSHSPSSEYRLFRPASPPRPLSGLPAVRAGVRGVSSSRLLESHARPGPSSARPSSKSRTNGSRRYSGFASSNSSGARPRLPRQRLQRPRMRPTPTHRHDSRVASNAVGPVRNAAIIPTSLPLSKTRSCRPTSATARGVVSRSPISQAPRIP